MLRRQLLTAAYALLLLTAMLMPWEAFGQADSLKVEIVWERELDSRISTSRFSSDITGRGEPNVGLDLTVPDGVNPVRTVVTLNSIYFLDGKGEVERQIHLQRSTVAELGKESNEVARDEVGSTSPDGSFYAIVNTWSAYESHHIEGVRVYRRDGNLAFELPNHQMPDKDRLGFVSFSPNSKFVIVSYTGPYGPDLFIDIYDLQGNLRQKLDIEGDSPTVIFWEGGRYIEIRYIRKSVVYDEWGNKVAKFPRKKRIEAMSKLLGRPIENLTEPLLKEIGSKASLTLRRPPESMTKKEKYRWDRLPLSEKIMVDWEKGYGVFNSGNKLTLFRFSKK